MAAQLPQSAPKSFFQKSLVDPLRNRRNYGWLEGKKRARVQSSISQFAQGMEQVAHAGMQWKGQVVKKISDTVVHKVEEKMAQPLKGREISKGSALALAAKKRTQVGVSTSGFWKTGVVMTGAIGLGVAGVVAAPVALGVAGAAFTAHKVTGKVKQVGKELPGKLAKLKAEKLLSGVQKSTITLANEEVEIFEDYATSGSKVKRMFTETNPTVEKPFEGLCGIEKFEVEDNYLSRAQLRQVPLSASGEVVGKRVEQEYHGQEIAEHFSNLVATHLPELLLLLPVEKRVGYIEQLETTLRQMQQELLLMSQNKQVSVEEMSHFMVSQLLGLLTNLSVEKRVEYVELLQESVGKISPTLLQAAKDKNVSSRAFVFGVANEVHRLTGGQYREHLAEGLIALITPNSKAQASLRSQMGEIFNSLDAASKDFSSSFGPQLCGFFASKIGSVVDLKIKGKPLFSILKSRNFHRLLDFAPDKARKMLQNKVKGSFALKRQKRSRGSSGGGGFVENQAIELAKRNGLIDNIASFARRMGEVFMDVTPAFHRARTLGAVQDVANDLIDGQSEVAQSSDPTVTGMVERLFASFKKLLR